MSELLHVLHVLKSMTSPLELLKLGLERRTVQNKLSINPLLFFVYFS